MEEIKPAESPKLNFNIKHLWDESTQSSSHATLVPKLFSQNPQTLWKTFPEELSLLKLQKVGRLHGTPQIENSMSLKLKCMWRHPAQHIV